MKSFDPFNLSLIKKNPFSLLIHDLEIILTNYFFLVKIRYIAPEQVPVQYGGLSREGEQEFSVADAVTEVTIKAATKHTVELHITEVCMIKKP